MGGLRIYSRNIEVALVTWRPAPQKSRASSRGGRPSSFSIGMAIVQMAAPSLPVNLKSGSLIARPLLAEVT